MSVLVTGAGAPLAPEELSAVRQVFALYDPNGMRARRALFAELH